MTEIVNILNFILTNTLCKDYSHCRFKKMKRIICLLFLVFLTLTVPLKSTAQTDSSSAGDNQSETLNDRLNNLLTDTKTALEDLRKQKDKKTRSAYKKLRLINKEIIKALNTVPPDKCLDALDNGMQDLYGLVSKLNIGISCGPIIIPPFLPGTSNRDVPVTPDCGLPPEMRATPFNGAFSIINPLYDNARSIFRTDENQNEVPDVCE